MEIVEWDRGSKRRGWNNKPWAPFSNDEDLEKDSTLKA